MMPRVKYFDDAVVGEEYDFPGEYVLTQEDIVRVASEWDPQPFHIDEEAAAASMFGGLVASSVHLFSIAVKLAHTATEKRAAVSALGFDDVKVLRPARPGDRCAIGRAASANENRRAVPRWESSKPAASSSTSTAKSSSR